MKLFKVVFETEIMILAKDENEAISNAEYYVKDETPRYQYSEMVETMYELKKSPEWIGSIPYSALKGYNDFENRCEDFVV
jgi:hypothetical protein